MKNLKNLKNQGREEDAKNCGFLIKENQEKYKGDDDAQ